MSDIPKRISPDSKMPAELNKALIIALIIGIIVSVPLIINSLQGEYYSSLYLLPDKYTNYPDSNSTSFVYGVKCCEKGFTNYYLDIYLGDTFFSREELSLFPGNCIENGKKLDLKGLKLPLKVNVILKSPYDTYKVGYWIKDSE